MSVIVYSATILLAIGAVMSIYHWTIGLGPASKGVQEGIIATSLLFISIYHFFAAEGYFLAGIACTSVAVLIMVSNVQRCYED